MIAPLNITKDIALDINGQDISSTGYALLADGATVTIGDSTAAQTVKGRTVSYNGGKLIGKGTAAIQAINGGKVIINSGQISAPNGIGVIAYGNNKNETAEPVASTIEVNGGYICAREFAASAQARGAILNINGGILEAKDNAVVAGNGSIGENNFLGDATININNATLIGNIESAGYIACGVYQPQRGVTTISNTKMEINNGVGVLSRGGQITVEGCDIRTSGTVSGKVGDSRVITGCYGVCVDISSKYYDNSNAKVVIDNTTVTAESDAVKVMSSDESDNNRIQINSGTFSSDPTAFAAGKEVKQDSDKFIVY